MMLQSRRIHYRMISVLATMTEEDLGYLQKSLAVETIVFI